MRLASAALEVAPVTARRVALGTKLFRGSGADVTFNPAVSRIVVFARCSVAALRAVFRVYSVP